MDVQDQIGGSFSGASMSLGDVPGTKEMDLRAVGEIKLTGIEDR